MINIKLSFPDPNWPILRQTPGGKGIWENCQFFVNDEIREYDYWVVYDNLLNPNISKSKCNILITGEPESVKSYNPSFLKQFDYVITCQENLKHNHLIFSQEALPWQIGRIQNNHNTFSFARNYDDLKNLAFYNKEKQISLISSSKQITKGHKERINFIQKIQSELNSGIDIYGRGFNEVGDKWDAIAPYKYHLVIENSSFPNYWTEKLADCYLAGSFPIYYGCTNLNDFFPENSFMAINIKDPENAIRIINKCINEKLYENNLDKINLCKNLILDKYNFFPMLVDFINSGRLLTGRKYFVKKTLYPENWSVLKEIKSKLLEII